MSLVRNLKNIITPSKVAIAVVAYSLSASMSASAMISITETPDDSAITSQVRQSLGNRATYGGITVQTFHHVVYLYGKVDTSLEQAEIEETVRHVPQVADVVDEVTLASQM